MARPIWTDTARPSFDIELPIIGADGNSINLIGIAAREMDRARIDKETKQLVISYLFKSESYEDLLNKLDDMFIITTERT